LYAYIKEGYPAEFALKLATVHLNTPILILT